MVFICLSQTSVSFCMLLFYLSTYFINAWMPCLLTAHLSVCCASYSIRFTINNHWRDFPKEAQSIRVPTMWKQAEADFDSATSQLQSEYLLLLFFGKHSQNPSGTFKTGLTTTQTIDLILVWKYTCCLKVLFLDWRKFHQFKVHPAAWKNHCLLLCSSISSPTSSLCPSPLQTPACYSAMCPAVFMLLSTPHVWPGWLASASVPSLILKLNPAAGSSSLLPCLPSSTLCWAELANLCELSVEPSEHRQRELLSPLYLFLSIVISHQTNACAHTVLRCAGLSIFFSAVQSRVLT